MNVRISQVINHCPRNGNINILYCFKAQNLCRHKPETDFTQLAFTLHYIDCHKPVAAMSVSCRLCLTTCLGRDE